jgi:hypothetical protein
MTAPVTVDRRHRRMTRRRVLAGLGATVAGGLAFAGYVFGIEPRYRLRIQRYRLTPPGWPADFRLSIAVIADIHAGEPHMPTARIEEIVARTNALAPDVIALLGDYEAGHRFNTRAVPPSTWAALLAGLKAPLGVHAVLGNHDWWDDRAAQRSGLGPTHGRRALEAAGVPVYENNAVRLAKGGKSFWLAGLGDQIALQRGRLPNGRLRFIGLDDLPGTLAQVTDAAPVILLAHEPDIFPHVPKRVALTLCGHTHGGQVRLFGYSPIVPSQFGNRYAYGHIVEDHRHLIVSGGLGCSILPVRFGVPPEIVHVTLGA